MMCCHCGSLGYSGNHLKNYISSYRAPKITFGEFKFILEPYPCLGRIVWCARYQIWCVKMDSKSNEYILRWLGGHLGHIVVSTPLKMRLQLQYTVIPFCRKPAVSWQILSTTYEDTSHWISMLYDHHCCHPVCNSLDYNPSNIFILWPVTT